VQTELWTILSLLAALEIGLFKVQFYFPSLQAAAAAAFGLF